MKTELDDSITNLAGKLSRDPDNGQPSMLADGHYNRGLEYFKAGNYSTAASDFTAALKLDSNHAEARHALCVTCNNLGVEYAERKVFDRAITYFKLVLKLSPDDAGAKRNLELAQNDLSKTAVQAELTGVNRAKVESKSKTGFVVLVLLAVLFVAMGVGAGIQAGAIHIPEITISKPAALQTGAQILRM